MNILTFDIGVTNIRYALCDEQFRLSDDCARRADRQDEAVRRGLRCPPLGK